MNQIEKQVLPPIVFKSNRPTDQPVYSRFETELNALLSIRQLDIDNDIEMIFDWVNQTYARRFWQLNGSRQMLKKTYEDIIAHPRAHSFIIELDQKPVAQIDIYGVAGEELHNHIDGVSDFDCGLHLLMLPTKELQKGWSLYTLKNFQKYYFSFAQHTELFAEPDQNNMLANKLAMDAGFHFLKTIELSNKTANLYSIKRECFQ